jgi:hypothetical protein
MAEQFEGRDLSGSVFWGVDLEGARFRDVNMTNVSISHAFVVGVDIDGLVDQVTINGVDVTHYVNERDAWYPLRAMLGPDDPDGMRRAWAALEQAWATTIERARAVTEAELHESVGGEWSLVQTLRHLVFARDKWFTMPILGGEAFHPLGLPNTGSADFDWPGVDNAADPDLDEVLAVRAKQALALHNFLASVTPADLEGEVDVLENGRTPVIHCFHTVFEEEFEHNRYAVRDLAHFG